MQKLVGDVLLAWREAERVRMAAPIGSPESEAARAVAEQLRDLYGAVTRSEGTVSPDRLASYREALEQLRLREPATT